MALKLVRNQSAGAQTPALLSVPAVSVNLAFAAGQQSETFDYLVTPPFFEAEIGSLLQNRLKNWSKARTDVILSLDELTRGNLEIYLNMQPVTRRSLKTIFAEPEKYRLNECRRPGGGGETVYDLNLTCLVPQIGGGAAGEIV